MKKKWLPQWVSEYRDRHGKPRYRFRRKGFKPYTFKAGPGTEAFRTEYAACKSGVSSLPISPGEGRHKPGSFHDLITLYYRSPLFLDPSERTQIVYRGVIERWREKYGTAMVKDLEARHVSEMLAECLPHRTAANMLRKRLLALMDFAIGQGLARDNPVRATKPFKITSEGFHTWTEEEIEQYAARHPVGTKARLALDLLLWTGQRGGDVRVMGRSNYRSNGRFVVTQEKTKAVVSLPILPVLARSILATETGPFLFLQTSFGAPFTRKGFGNKFRQWCDEAGLPHCSAHGLRKSAARRFAEAGCSNQQIKSWTGHTTDSEVARYTAAASQEALSDAAATMLLANLAKRLATGPAQEVENK